MTNETRSFEELEQDVRQMGQDAGEGAASWLFDGNTSRETYVKVLKGIEDGDPEVMDMLPNPNLSGEWAGDPTPKSILEELGTDEDDPAADDLLLAWEEAASQAVVDEATRVAKLQLGIATPDPLEKIRFDDYSLPKYADGGYPLYYLDEQNNILCPTCANEDAGDPVVAYGIHYEGPPITCDDCSVAIESAYGDPEEEN